MTNPNEVWQVEANNQTYEASVEELCQWIAEGALLPADKVRRGNLRWIEAGKVPLLHGFFNAREHGLPFPVLQTMTDASTSAGDSQLTAENFASGQIISPSQSNDFQKDNPAQILPAKNQARNICNFHREETAKYVCDNCANLFCKLCPTSYGGSVKVCPMCGAMCREIIEVQARQKKQYEYQNALSSGFGFADFGRALAYPFKFKTSLIFGALMFMFFTLGQTASALGGTVLFASAIICGAFANALTFGCLANTLENFSQGNTSANFMPSFNDFEIWDDVIQPFFLSLAVYIISFGLLAALLAGAYYYAMQTANQIEADKNKIVNTVLPGTQNDLNSAKQIPQIKQITEQLKEKNTWKNGEMPDENTIVKIQSNAPNEEAGSQKMQAMINQSQKAELESVVGKTPEAETESLNQKWTNMMRLSMIFSIPIFLAFLWGVFYFPAACAVAGYTRSFTAVLNPLIGLDTIKRLGFNYAKILMMFLLLGILSFAASSILGKIFSPFDLPGMGNLPAKAVGSLFTFYFSIVFSVVLGYALYKSSDRLNLYRG